MQNKRIKIKQRQMPFLHSFIQSLLHHITKQTLHSPKRTINPFFGFAFLISPTIMPKITFTLLWLLFTFFTQYTHLAETASDLNAQNSVTLNLDELSDLFCQIGTGGPQKWTEMEKKIASHPNGKLIVRMANGVAIEQCQKHSFADSDSGNGTKMVESLSQLNIFKFLHGAAKGILQFCRKNEGAEKKCREWWRLRREQQCEALNAGTAFKRTHVQYFTEWRNKLQKNVNEMEMELKMNESLRQFDRLNLSLAEAPLPAGIPIFLTLFLLTLPDGSARRVNHVGVLLRGTEFHFTGKRGIEVFPNGEYERTEVSGYESKRICAFHVGSTRLRVAEVQFVFDQLNKGRFRPGTYKSGNFTQKTIHIGDDGGTVEVEYRKLDEPTANSCSRFAREFVRQIIAEDHEMDEENWPAPFQYALRTSIAEGEDNSAIYGRVFGPAGELCEPSSNEHFKKFMQL